MTEDAQERDKATFIEKAKVKLLPLFARYTGENILSDFYHRTAGILELIGYPSPLNLQTLTAGLVYDQTAITITK